MGGFIAACLFYVMKEEEKCTKYLQIYIFIFGRSENNKPIKITAARSLNFANIAKECKDRKGINIAGIIDSRFSICNRRYRKIFKIWRSI
jgi:hypothetical protein